MSHVVYFDSTMAGASPLSQTPGSAIPVFDDCLVNGFGSVTLDSLVVSDGVATATKGTGHNFAQIVTGVGPVIRIAGATPSGLNGDWRVTVISSSQFTFACPGVPDGTASGTITAKRAPAGWTKEFSGANKAVYRSPNTAGSQWYFLVNAYSTTRMAMTGYKTMSDADSGTRASMTAEVEIANSGAGNSAWNLIADDRTVWLKNLQVSPQAYSYFSGFGDFVPANPADVDCAFVGGFICLAMNPLKIDDQSILPISSVTSRLTLCSGYADQVSRGGNAYYPLLLMSHASGVVMPGGQSSNTAWPNALTGQTDVANILVLESGNPRGTLRGIWAPLHRYSNISGNTALPLPNGHTGLRVLVETWIGARSGAIIADLTGPW